MNRIILEEKVRTLQLLGEDDKAKALQKKIAQQFDLPTTARMQDKQAKDLQAKIAKDMKLYGDEEEEEKEKVAEDETNEGLWDNIHAKRKRGEAPAEKGDEDYPEKDAWEKAQKSEGYAEDLEAFRDHPRYQEAWDILNRHFKTVSMSQVDDIISAMFEFAQVDANIPRT